MIKIICSAQAYTYNAYHIVKAFYPAGEITNQVEEKASNYVEITFCDGRVIAVKKEEITVEQAAEKKAQIDKDVYKRQHCFTCFYEGWNKEICRRYDKSV